MPQTTKTFRVFVSSTFTDMRMERSILQKDVFPRLKALCENKGASFQDVDLRWGINEETQLVQKTMDGHLSWRNCEMSEAVTQTELHNPSW